MNKYLSSLQFFALIIGMVAMAGNSPALCAVPKAPTSLLASNILHNQITLRWTDASTDETGFELERSLNGTAFTKIADLRLNVATHTDTALLASTSYWYRVRAKNASGFSLYSNVVTATTKAPPVTIPKAPSNLTATAVSGSQINVKWSDNATDETGFELEFSLNGTAFAKLADVAAGTTAYQHTGLTPVTRYWYRVLAKNTAGKSAYSNVANAVTPDIAPKAPSALTAVATSTTQINLTWTDGSSNETGFQVERSPDGGAFVKIADVAANGVSYANTGLTFNTTYHYRVRALNAAGVSAYTQVASATTQNIPVPPAPENFTAVPTASELIQLRWTSVPGNVTGLVVERSKGSDLYFTEIAKLSATAVQYEDRGKLETADYYYRIKATNAGGSSPYSIMSIVRASTIITSSPKTNITWQLSGRSLVAEIPANVRARLLIFDNRGIVRTDRMLERYSHTDLHGLPAGIYVAVLETDGAFTTRKIFLY